MTLHPLRISILFILVFLAGVVKSQDDLIQKTDNDTSKVWLYLQESIKYRYSNPDKSIEYAEKALLISSSKNFHKQTKDALNNLGFLHLMKGEHQLALSEFRQALEIAQENNDTAGVGVCLNNMGNYYNYRGLKDRALDYYLQSLEIKEKIQDEQSISVNLTNIGVIYDEQKKFDLAKSTYERALTIKEKLNDSRGIALVSSNLGSMFLECDSVAVAKKYMQRSYALFTKINDLRGQVSALLPLARIHHQERQSNLALRTLDEAEILMDSLDDISSLTESHRIKAEIYLDLKDLNKAQKNAETSLDYSKTAGDLTAQIGAWKILSRVHEETGDKKAALETFKTATNLSDSINLVENEAYLEKLQIEYESELKDRKLKLQEQDIVLLNKDKKMRAYLIVGLVLIFLFSGLFFYGRFKRVLATRKQLKKEVELKNKELLTFTLQTAQKNEQIAHLKKGIEATISSTEDAPVLHQRKIDRLFNDVQSVERDWEEFRLRFEQIERSFFSALSQRFPHLSKTDVRICALVRLKLSSKEIANMLHITPESVNKSRYRLRKKLELSKDQDLDQFIASV